MSNDDRLKIIIVLLIILIMTIIFCTITIIEKLDLVQHSPSLVRIVGWMMSLKHLKAQIKHSFCLRFYYKRWYNINEIIIRGEVWKNM